MTGYPALTLNLTDSFVIRKIVGKQQKLALIELQRICLPSDVPLECSATGYSIAIYDAGQMIAFGLAKRSANYQKTMYLARAGVHPDYQGRGLQKTLIALREDWARSKGMKYSITDTANSSIASMRSLWVAGYRPFWPQQVKPWAMKNSVYWRKTL